MSGILFVVGGLTAVIGVALIGFGIPVNEFSFGNTLIQSGVTAIVGGVIVVALGVVVAQLQRLAESLTAKSPIRSSRPLDMFDNAGARPARAPFPPKPKSDMPSREPFAHEPHADVAGQVPADDRHSFAPSLRNPEESQMTVDDDVSLSPQHPAPRPSADHDEDVSQASLDSHESELSEHRSEPNLDAGWRPAARPAARQAHTAYFDAMWPSEAKDAKPAKDTIARASDTEFKPFEPKPFEPKNFESKAFEPKAFEPKYDMAQPAEPAPEPEPEAPAMEVEPQPAVAILKSGVVDGMAYTLYVDGSIEAELPQGNLRFASINELRAHLEKNS